MFIGRMGGDKIATLRFMLLAMTGISRKCVATTVLRNKDIKNTGVKVETFTPVALLTFSI